MTKRTKVWLGRREKRLLLALGFACVALVYHHMGWQMPELLQQAIDGSATIKTREVSSKAAVSLQPYMAKVVGVHDGDTLTVVQTDENEQAARYKIRMAEIDAPELKQPYGQAAKTALSELVFGKAVEIIPYENDRYGRTVAKVLLKSENNIIDVNKALVTSGNVWVYRDYLKDRSLLDIEAQAKTAKLGLWGLQRDQREAPWLYRKNERAER